MAILTLDLGTKCGWCLRQGANTVSGTWDLKGGRYDGGGMRYLRFRRQLSEVFASATIYAVFYEEVRRHIGTDAAHVYGGLMATLTSYCEGHSPKIPYEGVPVATIKKFIAGKGNVDKAAVIAAVRLLGFEPGDDNEADAIAIMLLKLDDPSSAALL